MKAVFFHWLIGLLFVAGIVLACGDPIEMPNPYFPWLNFIGVLFIGIATLIVNYVLKKI